MAADDRNGNEIDRTKLSFIFETFENIDISFPMLVKKGDILSWEPDISFSKQNEEDNKLTRLKDLWFKSFGPFVNYL